MKSAERIRTYFDYKAKADLIKAELKEINSHMANMEKMIIDSMMEEGITSVSLDGKNVSIRELKSWKTPKTPEEKAEVYFYIENMHGVETLESLLSINSRSLNSFFNAETEDRAALQQKLDAKSMAMPEFLKAPGSHLKLTIRNK